MDKVFNVIGIEKIKSKKGNEFALLHCTQSIPCGYRVNTCMIQVGNGITEEQFITIRDNLPLDIELKYFTFGQGGTLFVNAFCICDDGIDSSLPF